MQRLAMWTRFRILNAARAMVSEVGVERVTMRGIAKLANITAPAIYKHFKNKRALLDEVIKTGFEELDGEMLRASREATTAYDSLRGMVDKIVKFAETYPKLTDMMLAPRRDDSQPEARIIHTMQHWRARQLLDMGIMPFLPRELWAILRGDLSRKERKESSRDFVWRIFDRLVERPRGLRAAAA